MRHDVAVVGGGVAGSVAARELARRGLRVALYEKARFPRLKACGEGLLPHGLAALRAMGLEPPGVPVRGLRYVSPSGAVAAADFPGGARGLVVRRDRLDAFLFAAAAATPGVDAYPETAWDPGRPATWIVGADGLRSQFHRRPEFPAAAPSLRRVGLSTHVSGLEVDRERVEVVLHDRGELYLAPSEDGDALVACLFRAGALPEGGAAEDRVLELLRSLDVLRGRTRGLAFTTPVLACAPLGLRVGAVAAGNILLVGDAAGAPDPVTGEGMSLSILSARALAEAVAAGDPGRYVLERRRLAAGSEWLGRWLLRAARAPAIADRVVGALARRPELFGKLLEIAVGTRRPGGLSLADVAGLLA